MEIKDSLTTTNDNKLIAKLQEHKDILLMFIGSRILFLLIMLGSGTGLGNIINLFDGELYIRIAEYGYEHISLVAFFPVIPMIIRFIGIPGLLILNNLCFLASLYMLKKLNVGTTVLAITALSPMGFFSMLAYTESIFFTLTLAAYYNFQRGGKPIVTGILMGLGVMCRSSGAMLFFSTFAAMVVLFVKKKTTIKDIVITYIPATVLALVYPVYLHIQFGNWKAFVDVQYDYWIRIPSNLFHAIGVQIKMLFTSAYPFIDQADMVLARANEAISLVIVIALLYLSIKAIVDMIKKHSIDTNSLILVLYTLASVVAINATIRDPYLDAPTVSFYRYYFEIFALFILLAKEKPVAQRITLYATVLVSCITSYLFCMGVFFY